MTLHISQTLTENWIEERVFEFQRFLLVEKGSNHQEVQVFNCTRQKVSTVIEASCNVYNQFNEHTIQYIILKQIPSSLRIIENLKLTIYHFLYLCDSQNRLKMPISPSSASCPELDHITIHQFRFIKIIDTVVCWN